MSDMVPEVLNAALDSLFTPKEPGEQEYKGEDGLLYAVYVDDAGKVEWITKSSYDASQKAVVFETGHFSIYGIGYKNPAPAFTDITGHWVRTTSSLLPAEDCSPEQVTPPLVPTPA